MRFPTKNELIIEIWERLDCESVGASELEQIQAAVRETLGHGAVDSPATIARLLADEGARLRHPEVLQYDSVWRRQNISEAWEQFEFTSLAASAQAIVKLEAIRQEFEANQNQVELRLINQFVTDLRLELSFVERSKASSRRARAEAKEISAWLSIWRSSPNLFADWLDLRLNSNEFRDLFPDFSLLDQ